MGAPLAKWNVACVPRGNGAKDPKTYGVRNYNSDGRSGQCQVGSLSDAPALDSPVVTVTEPTGGEGTFLTHENGGGGQSHVLDTTVRLRRRPSPSPCFPPATGDEKAFEAPNLTVKQKEKKRVDERSRDGLSLGRWG